MSSLGFDTGTYTLVCCNRDENNNFATNKEINAFIKIKLENRFIFNLLKDRDVAMIERDGIAYVLGEAAVNMAFTMDDLKLQRPMKDGCVNPYEKEAYEILNIMIHSLITGIKQDKQVLYYCVPANAINQTTDADYHQKILQSIFDAYESEEGYKLAAFPINEGLALIYAELSDKSYTGISVSAGGGMVNVCFAIYGVPVFQFSIVNSGDWIDEMAAKATHESIAFINQEKTKINLTSQPTNMIERAIQTQYKIMIEKTIQGIQDGLEKSGKKARTNQPIDVVIAGGTSIPTGFDILFREILIQAKLPIAVGSIVRPPDPLYSVARGCLIAAENSVR